MFKNSWLKKVQFERKKCEARSAKMTSKLGKLGRCLKMV